MLNHRPRCIYTYTESHMTKEGGDNIDMEGLINVALGADGGNQEEQQHGRDNSSQ